MDNVPNFFISFHIVLTNATIGFSSVKNDYAVYHAHNSYNAFYVVKC